MYVCTLLERRAAVLYITYIYTYIYNLVKAENEIVNEKYSNIFQKEYVQYLND